MVLDREKLKIYMFRCIGAVMAIFVYSSSVVHCQTLQGNITRVIDADSVQFRSKNGKYITSRLIGIDAPERLQDFGKECSDILSNELKGKAITANIYDVDQYKRTLIKFSTATVPDLSLWLIEQGCAWEYLAPNELRDSYDSAEATARNNSIGLWSAENPIKPSVWRQMKRLGLL